VTCDFIISRTLQHKITTTQRIRDEKSEYYGVRFNGRPESRRKQKKTNDIRRKRLPRGEQDVVYYDNIIPTRFRTALVKKIPSRAAAFVNDLIVYVITCLLL